MKQLLLFFVVLWMLAVLLGRQEEVYSSQNFMEWEVSAQCLPHSDLEVPQRAHIRYAYLPSMDAAAQVQAFLSVDGAPEVALTRYAWGDPSPGWISILFKGPAVRAHSYCQENQNDKLLSLSYSRKENLQVFLSRAGEVSREELNPLDQFQRSTLHVPAQGSEHSEYSAGEGTSLPYWLQFSTPINFFSKEETVIKYNIQ